MKVAIYSRRDIEELLNGTFPQKVAVISFYDPKEKWMGKEYESVNYQNKASRLFQVALHDIDFDILDEYKLTYQTYFPEDKDLAEFILSAKADGFDIICQCDYGQSRSAGCAAAILEYFYKTGISVFTDYKYYPNQMVYHKVFDALEEADLGQ